MLGIFFFLFFCLLISYINAATNSWLSKKKISADISQMMYPIRGVLKKYRESWISAGYVYSIFDFFVTLCWYSCFLFMPISTAILNVQLIFDSCFACTCFSSSSIFAYSKKWIRESVSNFVWKTKLSAWTHSECWLWHMVSPPWTETKCFPWKREDVNDEERAWRPSTSTTDENIDEMKKIVLVKSA